MTYKGHVRNGAIVLDEPTRLPEGVPVNIELAIQLPDSNDETGLSFGERYAEVLGKARTLPEDASENHDHYLYGVAKR
jgi:hypothetical protein